MFNRHWGRLWKSAVALTVFGWCAGLYPAHAGPGSPPVEFIRDGVILSPGPGMVVSNVTIDGQRTTSSLLTGGRRLVEIPWRPRQKMVIEWRMGGDQHTLAATAPLRPVPWVAWSQPWTSDDGSRSAISAMSFSADGKLLAVGSLDGLIRVMETESGRTIWTLRRQGRVVKQLSFSPDSDRLYAGEQGPEGRIAAYAPRSGNSDSLWHFDTAGELGRSQPTDPESPWGWIDYPGAYRLMARGDDVLAAMSHSWPRQGQRMALARLYRLDGRTGSLRWSFPADGPLRQAITWFAVNRNAGIDQERIALPLQLPSGGIPRPGGADESRVVVLAGKSGLPQFDQVIAAEHPYRVAAFWRGVALSPDGRHLAVATEDGRGFLYEEGARGWRPVKRLRLVQPLRLGEVTVTATNGTLVALQEGPLFVTGATYIPREFRHAEDQPAAEHPQGNTLFAYTWSGELRWLWRLEANLVGLVLSAGHSVLVLAQGRVPAPRHGEFQGITVLAPGRAGSGRDKVLYRFGVEGRVVDNGLAVSPDGRWIALAEAPLVDSATRLSRGAHRVHLLR